MKLPQYLQKEHDGFTPQEKQNYAKLLQGLKACRTLEGITKWYSKLSMSKETMLLYYSMLEDDLQQYRSNQRIERERLLKLLHDNGYSLWVVADIMRFEEDDFKLWLDARVIAVCSKSGMSMADIGEYLLGGIARETAQRRKKLAIEKGLYPFWLGEPESENTEESSPKRAGGDV